MTKFIKVWNEEQARITIDVPDTFPQPKGTTQEVADGVFSHFLDMLKSDKFEYSEGAEHIIPALQSCKPFKELMADILTGYEVDEADFNSLATLIAHFVLAGYLIGDGEIASGRLAALLGEYEN